MSEKSTEFKKGVTLKVITRKRTVKFLSFVLALLVATSIFPLTVSASAATRPELVDSETINRRFNELLKLTGQYFTVNHKPCISAPGKSNHGCSNCYNFNVVQAKWLKETLMVPSSPSQTLPKQYYPNAMGYPGGSSCHGFANYALWYLYAGKPTDDVIGVLVGKGELSYDTLKRLDAKRGDVIRIEGPTGGHSVVLYSYDRNGLKYLQCNGTRNNDGNCRITFLDATYSQFKGYFAQGAGSIAITRGENYKATVSLPQAPTLSLSSPEKTAVGKNATVTWGKVANADKYSVTMKNTETGETVSQNVAGNVLRADFKLSKAGTYEFSAYSSNSAGNSAVAKLSRTVTAYNPCKVVFLNDDKSVLSTQYVNYGENATPPSAPEKEHYIFERWDGTYSNITGDTEIKAVYKPKIYTVKFLVLRNGKYEPESTQYVEYLKSATPPNVKVPEGYVQSGWDKDYSSITEDMNIYCNQLWYNNNMSVYVSNLKAVRDTNGNGYTVTFDVINNGTTLTSGRAIVAVKTAEDKLVETTESSAFSLNPGVTKSMEIFVPSDEVATIADVYVVEKFSSAIPVSNSARTSIVHKKNWSEWSEEPAPAGAVEVETKTEYRYRTKSTVQSGYDTLDGYTKYDTKTSTSVASNWVAKKPSTSPDYTDTGKKTYSYQTGWVYYSHGWTFDGGNDWAYAYGETKASVIRAGRSFYPDRSDSALEKGYRYFYTGPLSYKGPDFKDSLWVNYDYPYGKTSGSVYVANTRFWLDHEVYKVTTTTTTNYFYKWSDWSNWSTESVEASDEKEVETRTLYRYTTSTTEGLENTDGKEITVSGTVSKDFAGREATLFIYKVDEASDYTNEYVGQTKIGVDGSYSFTFKLREEPTLKTGDFTATLGIEGTTTALYLDGIKELKAPVQTYTVEFVDYDGRTVSKQTVKDGENATVPDVVLSRTGYTFVGWNSTATNVHRDMRITARYNINTFKVVFVDWAKETVDIKMFEYGSELVCPTGSDEEDAYFIGWDKPLSGVNSVTEDLVVTAVYKTKTFTVTSYDWHGNVLRTETVNYGEEATLPEPLSEESYIFRSWKYDGDISCVKQNITITPNYEFETTVEKPIVSIEDGVYSEGQTVTISCPTKDAKIYYTLDGSNPENGHTYSSPLKIEKTSILKVIAVKENMNDSETVGKYIVINNTNKESGYKSYDELPQYVKDEPVKYGLKYIGTAYKIKNIYTTASKTQAHDFKVEGKTYIGEEWSSWSEWSKEMPDLSDMKSETEYKEAEAIPTDVYVYSHYSYFDEATKTTKYSAEKVDGEDCVYESFYTMAPLVVSKFVNGEPVYISDGAEWFNQTESVVDVPADYKLYRYRTVLYSYYDWSDWRLKRPVDGNGIEYESSKVYVYSVPEEYLVSVNCVNADREETSFKYIVNSGDLLSINEADYKVDGYSFEGIYKDAAYGEKWNVDTDVVLKSETLYAKQTLKTFKVRFLDYDNSVLSEQTVEYLNSAKIPENPERAGYVFTGWSNSPESIVGDTDFVAQYVAESEYVRVKLSRSRLSLMTGSSAKISVAITPESAVESEVVWYSSNPEIAEVDSLGNITAVHSGTAVITVISLETYETDNCVITVLGSLDTEILPVSKSAVKVDPAAKYLLGVKAGKNSINNINDELQNPGLIYTDIFGKAFDSDKDGTLPMGTGNKIKLMDGDYLVDEVQIVVTGDVNGDGATDVLDALNVEMVCNNHNTLDGAFFKAGDILTDDGVIDVNDYSAIINEALA